GHLVALEAPGREHDERGRGPFPQAPDELQPLQIGKAEIEEDHLRRARSRLRQPLASRARFEQADSVRRQGRSEEAANLQIVLDQQHGGREAGHPSPPLSRGARVTAGAPPSIGSVTRKPAPPPARFSAHIRPPWASTMARATARPRPTPCRDRAVSPRKNLSKIIFSSPGA